MLSMHRKLMAEVALESQTDYLQQVDRFGRLHTANLSQSYLVLSYHVIGQRSAAHCLTVHRSVDHETVLRRLHNSLPPNLSLSLSLTVSIPFYLSFTHTTSLLSFPTLSTTHLLCYSPCLHLLTIGNYTCSRNPPSSLQAQRELEQSILQDEGQTVRAIRSHGRGNGGEEERGGGGEEERGGGGEEERGGGG